MNTITDTSESSCAFFCCCCCWSHTYRKPPQKSGERMRTYSERVFDRNTGVVYSCAKSGGSAAVISRCPCDVIRKSRHSLHTRMKKENKQLHSHTGTRAAQTRKCLIFLLLSRLIFKSILILPSGAAFIRSQTSVPSPYSFPVGGKWRWM